MLHEFLRMVMLFLFTARMGGIALLRSCSYSSLNYFGYSTHQISALAQVLLDPFYRTIDGLMVLIAKDFVFFGHQFRSRIGGHDPAESSPVFLQVTSN